MRGCCRNCPASSWSASSIPTARRASTSPGTSSAAAFADLDGLIERGVDAVTIAAPTHLHRDIAIDCAARGIHILVEKPIASTIEEGREIVAAARRAGVTLMAGHVERFNPAVEAIKRAIKGQNILSIAVTRVGPFPPRMSNVGVVIDLAVHDIDLIRWFTNSEIVEIQPQTSSAVAEREDIALLQFRTASGVLAQINTNWLTPFKARTIHIATRDKYLMADLLDAAGHRMFRLPARRLLFDAAPVGRLRRAAAFRDGGLHQRHPRRPAPAVTGEEAVASLEIAIRCLSARTAQSSAPRKGPRRVVG